jgi:uncharacterized GH25 family protein
MGVTGLVEIVRLGLYRMTRKNIHDAKWQFKTKKHHVVLAFLPLLAFSPASAHDFWIQPERYWMGVGTPAPVSLFVGHGPDKHLWDADIKRIVSLTSLGPSGLVDQNGAFEQGGTGRLSFNERGFHVVALTTNSASSELPAASFNDYLTTEGLTPAIAFRQANNQTDRPGTEIYSRRAKLLVRVGNAVMTNAAHVTKPLGLTLEIVPEQNPYLVAAPAPLPFRIYYEGRPLSGATVKLNDLGADAKPAAKAISDTSGRVAFNVPRKGQWQVNVVWTKPLPQPQSPNASAQFDTIFSSLTFGFDTPPPL